MAIGKDLLERLLEGGNPAELFACNRLLDDLKKALSERILNAELDEHLSAERGESEASPRPNRRNASWCDRRKRG